MDSESMSTYEETDIQQEHFTVIAKKYNFSDELVHCPNQESSDHSEYSGSDHLLSSDYSLAVYANGNIDENKGYVSLTFHRLQMLKYFELVCIVSVIDAYGDRRFSMTFTFSSDFQNDPSQTVDYGKGLVIAKYIKRQRLLRESAELLPNDVLTLHTYFRASQIIVRREPLANFIIQIYIHSSFIEEEGAGGPVYYLNLDSPVAEHLSKESNYFKRILATSFTENREKRMNIPKEEYEHFIMAVEIVMGLSPLKYNSINDIFWVYNIADKYNIQIVTETCLHFLRMCFPTHGVKKMLTAANECSKWKFKEILLCIYPTTGKETPAKKMERYLKNAGYQWFYNHVNTDVESYLIFIKLTKPVVYQEEDVFDFYH